MAGVVTTKLIEQGFVWVFKIWIYECFPYMKTICTYNESIPWAIGWEKLRRSHWTSVQMIFGKFSEVTIPFIICYLSTNDLFMNY
ncbi:hypothetical protein R6Q57_009797 [Mikania cordata]